MRASQERQERISGMLMPGETGSYGDVLSRPLSGVHTRYKAKDDYACFLPSNNEKDRYPQVNSSRACSGA